MYDLHLIFTALLFGLFCAVYARSKRASIFHPVTYYLFFHGIVFVLRPFFQYYLEFTFVYDFYEFYPSMTTKHLALLSANLGLVSFVVAAMFFGNQLLRIPQTSPKEPRGGPQMLLTLLICSPAIAYSFALMLSGRLGEGSVSLIEMARVEDQNTTILTNVSGYALDSNQMLGAIGVVIAWAYRFRLPALLPFAIFIALRMYAGWARWTFIMAFASLFLFYLYDRRQRWIDLKIIVGFVVVLSVFHQLGANRNYLQQLVFGNQKEVVFIEEERHPLDGMDLANLEYLEYFIHIVPEQTGTYHYFLESLQVLTEPIPRILWPDKPVGAPIKLFNYMDYGNPVGITKSLPGQGWYDFGIIGVIFWCGLGGMMWGLFYRWFAESKKTIFNVALYCILLPLSIQWFRDGSLLTLFKFPLFLIIPLVVWYAICRMWPLRPQGRSRPVRRQRPPSPAAAHGAVPGPGVAAPHGRAASWGPEAP